MKNKNLSGIVFSEENNIQNRSFADIAVKCVLTIFSYLVFALSFFNMIDIEPNIACLILPTVIVFAQFLFAKKEKIYLTLNIVVLAVVVVFVLADLNNVINGAKLVFNQIFEVSEKCQSYLYGRFDITENKSEYNKCICSFALSVFAIMATAFSYAMIKVKRFIFAIVIALVSIFEIYFGIAPSWILNLMMFLSLFSLIAICSKHIKSATNSVQIIILFAVICFAISLATYVAYPTEYRQSNPVVNQWNEKIRDIFDEGEQAISNHISPNEVFDDTDSQVDNAQNDDGSGAKEESGDNNGVGGSKKHASNAKTVSVNFVTVIVFAVLLAVIAVWLLIVLISALKRNKMLKSSDKKAVINFAFVSTLKWLSVYGLELKNTVPLDYQKPLETLVSYDFAKEYKDVVLIWQETIYSDNQIIESQKQQTVDFYNQTKKLVFKKSNVFKKFKIKFIKLL
jgi:hypothetical protein